MHNFKKKKSQYGLTPVGLVIFLVLVGGLVYAWLYHLKPFVVDQNFLKASQKLEFNQFNEARTLFTQLLKSIPPDLKQTVQDRIEQIPLAEKHWSESAPENPFVTLQPLEGVTGKVGLLYIRYAIQNNSGQPLPIRRSLFYLKSDIGKCEIALDRPQNKEVSSLSEDLLPGEKSEGGICVKYFIVDPNEKLFLVYNNGKTYVNVIFPLSLLWVQTDKNQFQESWQGHKVSPAIVTKKMPAMQAPPESPKSTPPAKQDVTPASKPPAPPLITASPSTPAPSKPKPLNPAFYLNTEYAFSIRIPQGWQKIDRNVLPENHFGKVFQGIVLFKGQEWKGSFPLVLIQQRTQNLSLSAIGPELAASLEKEMRGLFSNLNAQVKQVNNRITLMGNLQAVEVDSVFSFGNQVFQMQSYVLAGHFDFFLHYCSTQEDFNSQMNQALELIRSFKKATAS